MKFKMKFKIKKKFTMKKLFDCADMPTNIRQTFWDLYESGNCSVVEHTLIGRNKSVDDWLAQNGASDSETVLIRYWW